MGFIKQRGLGGCMHGSPANAVCCVLRWVGYEIPRTGSCAGGPGTCAASMQSASLYVYECFCCTLAGLLGAFDAG